MTDSVQIWLYDDERRLRIKTGDILLYKGEGFISKLIQKVAGSSYSHVGIAAWWGEHLMVLEAVGHGVSTNRLSKNLEHYKGGVDYFWCKESISDEKRKLMLDFAQKQLGKSYDHKQVAVSGFKAFFGLVAKDKEGKVEREASKYFCSQYVNDIFLQANIDLAINLSGRNTSPGDIAKSSKLKKVAVLKKG